MAGRSRWLSRLNRSVTAWCMVDTPGVGGAVARHAVTTLALLPSADALVVLSDASQELTEPELSFLRQASTICPIVMCVLSKIDLTPHWRDVEAANRQHLESAGIDATILPVSANLLPHGALAR